MSGHPNQLLAMALENLQAASPLDDGQPGALRCTLDGFLIVAGTFPDSPYSFQALPWATAPEIGEEVGLVVSSLSYLVTPGGVDMIQQQGDANGNTKVVEGSVTPLGYQQIIGLVAATPLTVPATATRCVITPETQNVRWRDDGVAPTASVGYPLLVGQELEYNGNLAAIQFIQQTATATLNVNYYA